jgi:two-component system response regulator HydG
VTELAILVVELSDSFADLWKDLASGLGVALRRVGSANGDPIPADLVALVLAAGGMERDALEWLERHEVPPALPVFVVGADPGRRITAQIVRQGARDYFAVPEDVELLRNALAAAVTRGRQAIDRESAAGTARVFDRLVGRSPAFRTVLSRASRLLPHADATALIEGETGTGKELLARAIHDGSPRKTAPFVPVNCSALPSHLIESELFGHERGAFTDAHAAKPGLFEVADGGTLFLDEIGTLAPDLQAKLLRVLEDREVRRVGGTRSRRVDVRIIAATNENLNDGIQSGSFRQDLFFRLSVVRLRLPPLRERGEDVVIIAEQLVEQMARERDLPVPGLTPDAKRALMRHSWPGNVRELRNAVERALLLSLPGELNLSELLPEGEAPPVTSGPLPFPAALDHIAGAAARATVEYCHGNRSEAARRLHISRRRLRRLLAEDEPAEA